MGMAYVATAIGFLIGLYLALSPESYWRQHYGRMIKDAQPTDHGLGLIRRSGIGLMVFSVAMAVFVAWFQVRSERQARRMRETFDRETIERIMHVPGSPLDQHQEELPRP